MHAHPRSPLAPLAVALAAATLALGALAATTPPVADVPFQNGGITKDEADALRAQASRYPLELTLARRGETPGRNEFIADATLRVTDGAGHVVIERNDTGPIFLATLPDGRYKVEATYKGQVKAQEVQIGGGRHAHVTFLWD